MVALAQTRRRPRWWWELLAMVWLLWIYDAISNLAPLRKSEAIDHATDAWHFERILHLDPEHSLNHWLAGHLTIGLWVSDYYDNAHFVVTLGIIGWLWWRHQEAYRPLRSALVLTNVLGFLVFWLYPMAPPRLVPQGHIVDVVAATHAIGSWHSGTLATAGNANELASMPSLHIAWALWCAWALWQVLPRRPATMLVFAYPLMTAYAVIATGNHYLVDVVAGALTLVLAVLIADRLPNATLLRERLHLRARLALAWRRSSVPDTTVGDPVQGGRVAGGASAGTSSAGTSSAGTSSAGASSAGGSVVAGLHPPTAPLPHQEMGLAAHQTHLKPGSA